MELGSYFVSSKTSSSSDEVEHLPLISETLYC
jgi:hypothetical protein